MFAPRALQSARSAASGSARRVAAPRMAAQRSMALPRQQARAYASGPSAAVPKASDAPWAIGSVLVFGGLFLYLSSPSSKKDAHHGGGHGDKHDSHAAAKDDGEEEPKEDDDAASDDSSVSGHDEIEEIAKSKVEPKEQEADAPAGHHVLASRSVEAHDDAASKQKTGRDGPIARGDKHADNTTFAMATGAAKAGHKDGEQISSNPKAVVAASHADKAEKAEGRKAARAEKEGKSESDDKEEEKDE